MLNAPTDIFVNDASKAQISVKLPVLFAIAEAESKRGGKIGMEVGVMRERILISMFRHYFDPDNVNSDLPTTEPETDVLVRGIPISIKTITYTSKKFSGSGVKDSVDSGRRQCKRVRKDIQAFRRFSCSRTYLGAIPIQACFTFHGLCKNMCTPDLETRDMSRDTVWEPIRGDWNTLGRPCL